MSDPFIQYKAGYKYQLVSDYQISTKIKPANDVLTDYILLDTKGNLTVKKGYAWDGTSGPVIDTDENLRASLVHDAFYQLMRMRKLKSAEHKEASDKLFRNMCKIDGVPSPVAQLYYFALEKMGKPSTDPANAKTIYKAPQ
ncbi:DUF1353 domain-containing protein [Aliiglaciecola sp.]|nr:DUF1353 domain-containing protein [Aliiglaciecola sp.]